VSDSPAVGGGPGPPGADFRPPPAPRASPAPRPPPHRPRSEDVAAPTAVMQMNMSDTQGGDQANSAAAAAGGAGLLQLNLDGLQLQLAGLAETGTGPGRCAATRSPAVQRLLGCA